MAYYFVAIARASQSLYLRSFGVCERQRSPACGPGSESRLQQLCSALFRTARLPADWFHITVDGAGGQRRDNLMKTKRALSVKPLVAGTRLKQNQMTCCEHAFLRFM